MEKKSTPPNTKKLDKMSMSELMKLLERVIEQLESQGLDLELAIDLFEEAKKYEKLCYEKLKELTLRFSRLNLEIEKEEEAAECKPLP